MSADQCPAIENVYKYIVSFIHGPAGTGKTTTAIRLVLHLSGRLPVDSKPVLLIATTYNTAKELVRKMKEIERDTGFDFGANLLQTHSQSDAKTQNPLAADKDIEDNMIHMQCYHLAGSVHERHGEFFAPTFHTGFMGLRDKQYIVNSALKQAYYRERPGVAATVLKRAKVVVGTPFTSTLR